MLVYTEKEQISLPLDTVKENLEPMEPNPDYIDGFLLESEMMDSPPLPKPTIYTDVNVVPEHEKDELQQSILNLEGEITQLREKERLLDKKRREALNKILDIKGSIRVFCRVRPFLLSDMRRIHEPISTGLEKVVVRSVEIRKVYRFDKVFNQAACQEDVFLEVEPILRSALDGHNVCILAYGQTGTGKTFTMDGTNNQAGIIPRTIDELFHQASLDSSSMTFSMSMLEVYMGNLRDLLAPRVALRTYEAAAKCNLNIQTDQKGLVEVEGLTQVQIPDVAKAKWWYAKGRRARSTSWTNVNETSSRSHCLMRITISRHGDNSKGKTQVSKLWMVDLGGSERLLKTGATGQTLDEGRAINLSLSALGDVVAALRRKRGHVPYRNSKLTQILKDSLGDSSKVLMVVHISPCEEDVGESICSLSFANRARAIETTRDGEEDINKQRLKRILELEGDMREAEEECQKARNQIQKAKLMLSENRRLLSASELPEGKENMPISPEQDNKEFNATPQVAKKGIRRNMTGPIPRFMNSTVASRQRQNAAEKEVVGRARSLKSTTRSSLQFSASQSLSYSDFRLRTILRESNRKSRYGETKPLVLESPRCNGLGTKTASFPRTKLVNSSDPNLRTTLSRHRRRMSDLI